MGGNISKGIILAGGNGSRLYPVTRVICKQLLSIYDKPMIYYPLATLMQFGIRDILIISTPQDIEHFRRLFGEGRNLGLDISYAVQDRPEGIAQAFLIGRDFIGTGPVALILGDNIFYGISGIAPEIDRFRAGALIFGYFMQHPERYGVIEYDLEGKVIGIEEKPKKPKSNFAVTGFYIYDAGVIDIAAGLKPSKRGELEITDVNNAYLKQGRLKVVKLGRDAAWLDTGTYESLRHAGNFVAAIENRQGIKLGCIEEVALQCGLVEMDQFCALVEDMPENEYKNYLIEILTGQGHAL
nr:glucose-1-phosphate thymidylyltransferase RfbA [candidate division Zixibacteria bacterium]